ncbi:MAG: DMT family transporter [Desulfurococcales archaeon]|nr:DMT family transporter [Desulfurococcales archaeon]
MPEGRGGGQPLHPALALAVAVASISWAAVLYRLAGVPGVDAAWWRLLVGSAITGLLARSAPAMLEPLHAAAGLSLAAHFTLWFESLRYTSVAASTGIVVTYPVYVTAAEVLVDREPICARRALGPIAAVAGVALLAEPWKGGLTLLGGLLALAGALAASLYFYLGRRARRAGAPLGGYTLSVYTWALVGASLWALASASNPLGVPRGSLPFLVLLGVVPMLGGHTMMNYALRYYPASTVTTVALLEPFGASLLAWLLLGEEPPPLALPGLALAVGGSALTLLGCGGAGEPAED